MEKIHTMENPQLLFQQIYFLTKRNQTKFIFAQFNPRICDTSTFFFFYHLQLKRVNVNAKNRFHRSFPFPWKVETPSKGNSGGL